MAYNGSKSWVRRRVENAIRGAFMKAYDTVKVNPEHYLQHLRIAYDLPVVTYDGVYSVDPDVLDSIAEETIRAHMRMAAAEGAGLGLGGMLTMLPDLGILSAITLRMIQKLSLLYGFPYNTEEEEAELLGSCGQRSGSGHQPRAGREAICQAIHSARHSAHRRQRQRRNRGEVDRAT